MMQAGPISPAGWFRVMTLSTMERRISGEEEPTASREMFATAPVKEIATMRGMREG